MDCKQKYYFVAVSQNCNKFRVNNTWQFNLDVLVALLVFNPIFPNDETPKVSLEQPTNAVKAQKRNRAAIIYLCHASSTLPRGRNLVVTMAEWRLRLSLICMKRKGFMYFVGNVTIYGITSWHLFNRSRRFSIYVQIWGLFWTQLT